MHFNDCIVLAGGAGSRLWPASSTKNPKQFLSVPPDKCFLSAAVERALMLIQDSNDSKVLIITGKDHIQAVTEVCAGFTNEQRKHLVLIPEPDAKNTAPAIASGLLYINWAAGGIDRNILVLTSDHIISPFEVLKADSAAAAAFAQQDKLVVFGIPALSPNTGYGYIESSDLLSVPAGEEERKKGHYEPLVYRAKSFREKPDKKKAEEFIKAGNFCWNSGMFAFSSKFLLKEFREKAPDVFLPFLRLRAPDERSHEIRKGLRILEKWEGLDSTYNEAARISFDYAIAEKCTQTVMVKAAFQWTDVGCWDEYARVLTEASSIPKSEVYRIASESTFVDSDIPVALVNAEDLIVVIRTEKNALQAALIAKKGETQKVQEIVKQIRDKGRIELL